LGNPAIPPFLWNHFRENNLSGRSRNRAGGIRTQDSCRAMAVELGWREKRPREAVEKARGNPAYSFEV